eukprot:scaffold57688_cov59-Phaeocystis_antarctica.AAC.7
MLGWWPSNANTRIHLSIRPPHTQRHAARRDGDEPPPPLADRPRGPAPCPAHSATNHEPFLCCRSAVGRRSGLRISLRLAAYACLEACRAAWICAEEHP